MYLYLIVAIWARNALLYVNECVGDTVHESWLNIEVDNKSCGLARLDYRMYLTIHNYKLHCCFIVSCCVTSQGQALCPNLELMAFLTNAF